jgi:hypothetical protein
LRRKKTALRRFFQSKNKNYFLSVAAGAAAGAAAEASFFKACRDKGKCGCIDRL